MEAEIAISVANLFDTVERKLNRHFGVFVLQQANTSLFHMDF